MEILCNSWAVIRTVGSIIELNKISDSWEYDMDQAIRKQRNVPDGDDQALERLEEELGILHETLSHLRLSHIKSEKECLEGQEPFFLTQQCHLNAIEIY